MNHTKALLIKFVSSLIVLYIILGYFYGMTFGDVFLITLVLGIVSYIIGDMFILRRSNNFVATVSDFILAFIVIRLMSDNLIEGADGNLLQMSLIASLAVAVFEYFFHKYFAHNVLSDGETNDNNQRRNLKYQTEASEELAPNNINNQPNRDDVLS